ncbi:MAG: UbiA-like protein EboC [Candidatus Eremiobacterota bacterium]
MRDYLRLIRPANVVTAAADVLAGFAASGAPARPALGLLMLSGMCLYAGGVALNDLLDRREDALTRPERPIPSGRVSLLGAAILVALLLFSGLGLAFQVSPTSGVLAALLALLACLYDAWAKRRAFAGPLCMGSCRGLNLLLGVSLLPAALPGRCYLALLPVLYVGAITCVSRGEVERGRREAGRGLALLGASLVMLGCLSGGSPWSLGLLAWLGLRTGPAFWRAWRSRDPLHSRAAVRNGVLSLILLDGALAAAYAGPWLAALVLLLGFLARRLARAFEVS